MLIRNHVYKFTLVDQAGLPRYWAAVWAMLIGASLAPSTLKQRLTNIESFYQHVDSCQIGSLDDVLGDLNLPMLEEMLEAFFVNLTNVREIEETAAQRWKDALGFVRDICERISRTPALTESPRLYQKQITVL